MTRIIYTCKKCALTRAYDYDSTQRSKVGNRLVIDLCRVGENQKVIPAWKDYHCPCGSTAVKETRVKGQLSEHECNSECLNAQSAHCSCKCAGKNHGAAFKVI